MISTLRKSLQPPQQLILNGVLAVVVVEHSFLTFDNVQRRAAEAAAFQRCKEEPQYQATNRVPC